MLLTPNDLAPCDFVVSIVLLPVGGHFRHDTQDVTMYESLSLVASPLPGVLFVGLFLVGLLLFPGSVLGFWFLAVIAYWTAHKSITSTFVAIDYRQPCTIISIHLSLQSNVCNDLAEAMKALDGKKHFFGPCFRGHDEAGFLAFEALQGLPRPVRGTRTKRGSRGLESINTVVGVP